MCVCVCVCVCVCACACVCVCVCVCVVQVLVGKDYAVTSGYSTAHEAVAGFAKCTQER